jgi:hypothetical protein
MKCSEARRYISLCIDGEIDKIREDKLSDHIKICPDCSLFYKKMKSMDSSIKDTFAQKELPEEFKERLSGSFPDTVNKKRVWRMVNMKKYISLATAAVIMSILVIPWNGASLISRISKSPVPQGDKAGEIAVGEYRGLTVSIHKESWGILTIGLAGKHHYSNDMGTTEIGSVARIENMVERIPRQLAAEELKLSEVQNQLEEAKRQYGLPFVYEAELYEKSGRLTEVNTDLELGKAEDEEVVMDENGQGSNGEENIAAKGVFACVGAEV